MIDQNFQEIIEYAGDRLMRSDVVDSAKRPVLFRKGHWFIHLLIQKRQQRFLHLGVRETLDGV